MSGIPADCAAIMAGISGYLDGELERTECAKIEAHCAACARCTTVVEALRRTVGLCREAARAPLPEDVRARARASIRQLFEQETPRPAAGHGTGPTEGEN